MYGSHVQNYVNPKYYATKENSKWEINLTGDQNDHSILNDAKKTVLVKEAIRGAFKVNWLRINDNWFSFRQVMTSECVFWLE